MSRSILDYFSKKQSEAHFPDSKGLSSSKMLPFAIASANTEVMHMLVSNCKQIMNIVTLFTNKQLVYYWCPAVHMLNTNGKFYTNSTHPELTCAKVSHLTFSVQ